MMIPASVGEVLDKISILSIKLDRIADPDKLENIRREYDALTDAAKGARLPDLESDLYEINAKLWDVEDALREAEKSQAFDDDFIALARSVYLLNDERSRIKREISKLCNSELIEEKSYK